MAKMSLVVELEKDEKGNLLNDLKGVETEKILSMLIDAENKKGPASVYGVGSGERRITFDFKVSLSDLRKL